MAKLGISTGSSPNDGTGDSLIDGAVKANSNFTEIYTAIGDGTTLAIPVTSVTAGTGINLSGSTGSVTITNTGIANTNNLRTDFLEVSGISTLSGGLTVTGNATATQFVGGGAGITGISTLNIVNYSGGGAGVGNTNNIRTNFLEVSGISTFNGGVDITGNIDSTNLETGTGSLTLGNSSSQFDIRFSPSSGSSPAIRYNVTDGISIYGRYNGGADLLGKTVRFGDPSYFKNIVPKDDSTYNLGSNSTKWATVYTEGANIYGTLSVGIGSTEVTNTPSLTLSHNNPTVAGTAGTTGQVKQIGGQPYYYDGTTWRALFLVRVLHLTVNQADSDWDNTMIRMNFDQATIGDVTNLKDGRTPTTSQIDLVSSPIKYGTKTARFQVNNTGINFTQNNSGSTYYPFEGAWTLEGWFYFNSSALPNETNITNSPILFSNYHPNTGVSNNWKIGYYYSGSSTTYNFYWHNKNSSATGSNSAGNTSTGFLLDQRNSSTFADNAWHHIAIVREPGNGSIHYYFDGTESTRTSSDQLIDNEISDQTNQSFVVGYYGISGDAGQFEGNIDDIRVSKSARYTANFTPPASALPITGSTTTVYEPANSKVGEISLGGSPAWTGTPGVTASQIAAGQYRATFATAYSNATDYVIQTSMNDYTPATTPVGIGVSRFTTHADFFVKRVSDGANIDTGSLAIDLFKK